MNDSSVPSASRPSFEPFVRRHIGPRPSEVEAMVKVCGFASLDALVEAAVPAGIRLGRPLALPPALGEAEALARLRAIAGQNRVLRSFIGLGYHDTLTPPPIQRNILENPGWYTQYTPYQSEISQGRLEGLLNFQTLIADQRPVVRAKRSRPRRVPSDTSQRLDMTTE